MAPREWIRFIGFLRSTNVRISVLYGMSECNGVFGCHLSDVSYTVMPIGYPLPGVNYLLINEQGQIISCTNNSNDFGQIHIGGKQIFI